MTGSRAAIDHVTLGWIKPELDEILRQVRIEVEAFAEDTADVARMRASASALQGVRGSLRMLDLEATALVAEEMRLLSQALEQGRVTDPLEACAPLMRGLVLLPDYLEGLQAGYRDVPLALLPLLNDLRAARGENALDARVLQAMDGPVPPTDAELAHARASLSGRNRALLDTVSGAIKEELLQVKEAIDLHLRAGQQDPAALEPQVGALARVADTLRMIGMDAASGSVGRQRDALRSITNNERALDEDALLDIAGALLYVDNLLDDQGLAQGSAGAAGGDSPLAGESRKVGPVLMQETAANLARVRESLVAFIEAKWDHGQLSQVPMLLQEVAGALRILEQAQPADLTTGLQRYFETELVDARRVPSGRVLDTLADALTSLDMYLEAFGRDKSRREDLLDIVRSSVALLGYWPLPAAALRSPPAVDLRDRHAVDAHDSVSAVAHDDAHAAPRTETPLAADAGAAVAASAGAGAGPAAGGMLGFDKVGDEIDDEIREVFVEEFEEEIQNLSQLVPQWRATPGDAEALRPIRRVFHTLKGSGRLVGASVLGEFSWKIENMLNRVLDGSRPASPAVIALVENAQAALPQLYAALRDASPVDADLEGMASVADRVAAGEEIFHDAQAPAQAATGIAAPVAAPENQGEGIQAWVDPVLMEILDAEIAGHLQTIDTWLANALSSPRVDEGLVRALHTSNGAFAMTEVPAITDALGPAEGYVKGLFAAKLAASAEGVAAIAATAAAVRATMAALHQPSPRVQPQPQLVSQFKALRSALPETAPTALHEDDDALPATSFDVLGVAAGALAPDAPEPLEPFDTVDDGAEAERQEALGREARLLEQERIAFERAETARIAAAQAEAERLAAEQVETARLAAEQAKAERVAAEHAEAERVAAEQAEAERVAAEQAEAERLAAEHAEAERVAAEQAEAERVAAEQAEAERVAAEQAEAERVAAEQAEAERIAAERAEAERLAAERAEAERLAAERAEAERLAAEQAEAEGIAAEQAEVDRVAREEEAEYARLEAEYAEQARLKAEAERHAAEQAERERIAAMQDAAERAAAEQAAAERIAAEQAQAERLAAEKAEADRLAAERAEAERIAAEQAEAERLAAEQAEADRLAVERAEAERVAAEHAAAEHAEAERLAAEQAERVAAEQAETERVAAEQAETERLAAEQAEAERLAAEQAEAERIAAEQAEADRAAAEQAEAERLAAEQAEAERVAAEQAEVDRLAAEQAEAERLAAEKAEAERLAAEQAEAERLAAEQAESERLAAEQAEAERLAAEQAEAERLEVERAETERRAAEEAEARRRRAAEEAEARRVADAQAEAERAAEKQRAQDAQVAALLASAASVASAEDPDEALDLSDLDPELVDLFVEEAHDLLDHSDGLLAKLRDAPADREPVVGLQRDLHTIKGGARMAGVMAVGELGHAMESLLELVAAQRTDLGSADIPLLERGFDRLHGMVTRVGARRAIGLPSHLIAEFDARARGEAPPVPGSVVVPARTLEPSPLSAPIGDDDDDVGMRLPQEQVRIRADLLDKLVNYAGEVAIYRARLEQQLGAFRSAMFEMEQTNARLRDQLRRLDSETEAQIIARYQRESDAADQTFDPLELDRFSTLQQLSRGLGESAADMASLQGTLDDLTRQYETLLLQQSRVSSDLQEGLMRTRMVPFDALVPRLRRVVRQAATDTGKQVQLRLEGASGELDRNVLERMTAPLEHMLRNAIAHGLETRAGRKQAGKDEEGTVRIAVRREGSEVVLAVGDDGAGLDRAAIRSRAIERGLMRDDAQLPDTALDAMILEPGFSTAAEVSRLAGRGVGMDVVASEVRQLGGTLDIATRAGAGTTFTLRLPQTLAVTQAVFVRIGETTFAVPIASVRGVGRVSRAELVQAGGTYRYGGEDYALHDLGTLLGQPASRAEGQQQVPLLLIRSGDLLAAISVDQVMGNREIVVKPVGPQVASIPGIFGATIMGDGGVVVILDVAPLVRRHVAASRGTEPVALPELRHVPLVMVVDDSITMRKVTGRVLERHNYEVITANDGIHALERMDERIPDLMLLDIEMPRMDGYELARLMRSDSRLRGVPIIMITSRTGEKHRQRAFELGVQRYLGKPYQENDLMRNVKELLGVDGADHGDD